MLYHLFSLLKSFDCHTFLTLSGLILLLLCICQMNHKINILDDSFYCQSIHLILNNFILNYNIILIILLGYFCWIVIFVFLTRDLARLTWDPEHLASGPECTFYLLGSFIVYFSRLRAQERKEKVNCALNVRLKWIKKLWRYYVTGGK